MWLVRIRSPIPLKIHKALLKGNMRIKIKSLSFSTQWGLEPHPSVSVRPQVSFYLNWSCVSNRNHFRELLNAWQTTVIKGNAAEIGALSDSSEVSWTTLTITQIHPFVVHRSPVSCFEGTIERRGQRGVWICGSRVCGAIARAQRA